GSTRGTFPRTVPPSDRPPPPIRPPLPQGSPRRQLPPRSPGPRHPGLRPLRLLRSLPRSALPRHPCGFRGLRPRSTDSLFLPLSTDPPSFWLPSPAREAENKPYGSVPFRGHELESSRNHKNLHRPTPVPTHPRAPQPARAAH